MGFNSGFKGLNQIMTLIFNDLLYRTPAHRMAILSGVWLLPNGDVVIQQIKFRRVLQKWVEVKGGRHQNDSYKLVITGRLIW